ncbi:MAG: FlgD immunoglobulin-like domain containing protein, partial [bacterium]
PNPERSAASASLGIERPARDRVTVHDAAGRAVRVLLDGDVPAGVHRVGWDLRSVAARRVPAGIYFLRLQAGEVRLARKVAVVR